MAGLPFIEGREGEGGGEERSPNLDPTIRLGQARKKSLHLSATQRSFHERRKKNQRAPVAIERLLFGHQSQSSFTTYILNILESMQLVEALVLLAGTENSKYVRAAFSETSLRRPGEKSGLQW